MQIDCIEPCHLWTMQNIVICPACQTPLDIEDAIKENLERNINAEFIKKKAELEQEFIAKDEILKSKERALTNEKQRQDRIISEKLKTSEEILRKKIGSEIAEKTSLELEGLRKENQERKDALRNIQKRELELLQQKQKNDEERETLELRVEREIAEKRKSIEDNARKKEQDAQQIKTQESEYLINSLKQQIDNIQRKIDQGSMQVQGEVMEVELEKLLGQTFPFDEISEVVKGVNGADILHKVRNLQMYDCGTIIFESKRAKAFSGS